MSSNKRKPDKKKKIIETPSSENKANNFGRDLNTLKKLNLTSLSEPRIGQQEHEVIRKYSSLPNLSFNPDPVIEVYEFLPGPDNSLAPCLGIWKFITEETMSILRQSPIENAKEIIGKVLEEKKLSGENLSVTTTLIFTILKWAFEKEYSDFKASTLAFCFFSTHEFFLSSTWRNQLEVYKFFKDTLIRHTIEDPPLCNQVFTIYECKDCLLYFCDIYLQVLPLLRYKLIPNKRIKLIWRNERETTNKLTN